MTLVALAGCAEPQVTYRQTTSDGLSEFKDSALSFRIARSLVLVSDQPNASGGVQGSVAAAAEPKSTLAVFNPIVIDPAEAPAGGAWSEWDELPLQPDDTADPKYWYRLRLTPDSVVSITPEQLIQLGQTSLKVFPVPTCPSLDLELGATDDNGFNAIKTRNIVAAAVPTEIAPVSMNGIDAPNMSIVWRMNGIDNLLSKTRLQMTYFPNTLLPKEVGVTVQDNTDAVIKAISGIATTAIGLSVAGGKVETVRSFNLKVSDDRLLRSVPLPGKGKIAMSEACTVNVSDESTASSADAIGHLNTLITQVASVRTAWLKAKADAAAGGQ